jgi:hypothetical protein
MHRNDYRRSPRKSSLGFVAPWDGGPAPWTYVYDRPPYPLAHGADPLTVQLQRLARPSPRVEGAVQCATRACVDATQTLEGQQACQCASLRLACQLGGDSLDPTAMTFCASLATDSTLCNSLNPTLIGGFAVTAAPQIVGACFR